MASSTRDFLDGKITATEFDKRTRKPAKKVAKKRRKKLPPHVAVISSASKRRKKPAKKARKALSPIGVIQDRLKTRNKRLGDVMKEVKGSAR